jgi:SAM-dependent methyltransferase
MGWQEAGQAWGARATDWSELMEPHFGPVYEALCDGVPIRSGTRVLDVGCGSGLALSFYAMRDAVCSGIDAAQGLLDIAQTRVPSADLRLGSMNELPWPDGSFDAVVGVNAFVYSDDGALAEAHRVLRPGGTLGVGFWTDPGDFGWPMAELGAALAPYVEPEQTATPLRMADPAVRATALASSGFIQERSGEVEAVTRFDDGPTAYRALASTGMIHPLVVANAEADVRSRTLQWMAQRSGDGLRFASAFGWVAATRE